MIASSVISKFLHTYQYPILILILAFPLFYNLNELTIRLWDESRLVANTMAMYHNKEYLIPYYNGEPDMWNTKPPLMVWVHLLFVHLIGFNELSFRIGSALFGLLTGLYIYRFTFKETGNIWMAFASAFILISSRGFVDSHVTRTGEYDAMLIYWAVCAFGALYRFCIYGKYQYAYYFAVFLGLAVLTKGPAVLLFGPAVVLYLIFSKQFLKVVTSKHIYGALILFVIIVLSYYLTREYYNPGYIQAVLDNELGGRFMEVKDEQNGSWYYYIEWMSGRNFMLWMPFIPIGIYFFFKEKNVKMKQFVLFSLCLSFGFLLMISMAQTKLRWYDAPIYPFFAMLVAYAITSFYSLLKERWQHKWSLGIINGVLVIIFTLAYTLVVVENTMGSKTRDYGHGVFDISYLIRDEMLPNPKDSLMRIYQSFYLPSNDLYIYHLQNTGTKVELMQLNKMPKGAAVWVQNQIMMDSLQMSLTQPLLIIDSFYAAKKVVIP